MTVIGNEWDELLQIEYQKPYFTALMKAVELEYATKTVYPPRAQVYSAMAKVPYDKVKVVIIGQDPYHGEGQANGMAFAVGKGIQLPPSLVNIFKEIENDIGATPNGSTLTGWAEQGVLLLNTVLTVRASSPQSHSGFGWQQFTDEIISLLSKRETPMVFMLWGANALRKKQFIAPHHLVLESVHPSPLSAYRGFFGCKHFSKANEFLKKTGQGAIDWAYSDIIEPEGYYNATGSIKRV